MIRLENHVIDERDVINSESMTLNVPYSPTGQLVGFIDVVFLKLTTRDGTFLIYEKGSTESELLEDVIEKAKRYNMGSLDEDERSKLRVFKYFYDAYINNTYEYILDATEMSLTDICDLMLADIDAQEAEFEAQRTAKLAEIDAQLAEQIAEHNRQYPDRPISFENLLKDSQRLGADGRRRIREEARKRHGVEPDIDANINI
ncbi:hypothetical protein D081_0810 [Anaerovibrio sp. JC8]|uniref:hypothetical protein n=1 Tax=Anaerovibrio sp. JC8 TaxID=1240085 RepID=UPI000A0A1295|nr:hypothetical protein [Anaerovibrio sp. JC8]ORU00828.1 hypothetical protein D081_0810 [Anaerovibrio sp. JC8]